MKTIFIFIVIVAIALPSKQSSAATLTSNGTGGGDWDATSSWDGANTPEDMSDGDTLVILASDVITITKNRSFNGVIQIYGTFSMDKGKLSMNSSSVIQLFAGSVIEALNNGQNEKINIGSSGIASDEINSIVTPTILTEATLPVEVIYFKATEMPGAIKLEWATSFEEDFDYFTLERSSDGRIFNDHVKIYSNTTLSSFTKKYEYIDEMPFPGLSYYRLKATDFNGSFEYHGVVSANLEDAEADILIYSNPNVRDHITISYNGVQESPFRIIDITGKMIEEGILMPGLNEIMISPSIHSSLYFIQVEGSSSPIVKKFVLR